MTTAHRGPAAPRIIPGDVLEAVALYADRLGVFGDHIHWHAEARSTNDEALRMADHGAVEGTVVGADAQTAGRGRRGRAWASPAGAGLYVSVILRPATPVVPLLTIAAGVAIADGIREVSGLATVLKWPNDVYAGSRKLAGILAEAGGTRQGSYVVVGFGVNLLPGAYPPDVAVRATSLGGELGRPVDRGLLLAACLAALARRYDELMRHTSSVVSAWRSYAASTLNRRVTATVGARVVTGVAEDIDDQGALLVRTSVGVDRIVSGEVLWH